MWKFSKKKLGALCCVAALVTTCSISASAKSQDWSVNFPRAKKFTDIISDTKQTPYSSIKYVNVGLDKISQYATSGEFIIRADLDGWKNVSQKKQYMPESPIVSQ